MANAQLDPTHPISGSAIALIQFAVSEELQLDALQQAIQARPLHLPRMKPTVPSSVQYERPPITEQLDPLVLENGERLEGEIKYYDYGVVSVLYHLPFNSSWSDLTLLASRWIWEIDFARHVEPLVRQRLAAATTAMVKPYDQWLSEDYFIFHIREVEGNPAADQLLRSHGQQIAQLVRGDRQTLSAGECAEVLSSQISYYASDSAVIGWNAAFLYDSIAGAATAIQLLEYANSQLLEFRHYDVLLTGILEGVYQLIDDKHSLWARWRLSHSATKLHRVLLDVEELTERADNSIKFLSDMFSARFYRLAAARVGVPDYKNLVAQKLKIAEDLYQFMVEQFNHSRAFFLEATVVLILLIELYYFFRGHL